MGTCSTGGCGMQIGEDLHDPHPPSRSLFLPLVGRGFSGISGRYGLISHQELGCRSSWCLGFMLLSHCNSRRSQ